MGKFFRAFGEKSLEAFFLESSIEVLGQFTNEFFEGVMSYNYRLKTRDRIEKPVKLSRGSFCPQCDTPFSGKKCPKCGFSRRKHNKKHKQEREAA